MGSQPGQLCQPIQPSTDHLHRVEGCEEEVPAEEATHSTRGSLPPGEEGEEEGAEQDGSLQVPRDGDRGEIAEEVDDGGGLGQDCQHHEDVNTINCIYEEDEDRKLTSCQFCLK